MLYFLSKTLLVVLFFTVGLTTVSCAADSKGTKGKALQPGLYAIFQTNKGTFTCRLFEKEAPKTVDNFVGLANGTKEWTDPKTGKKVQKRFYDGLIFHRVIPKFMIQGGDPEGTGRGGPGYKFEDECRPDLIFDKSGKLAMANAGPNTNGSQFFITTVPTPWLNNKHTIFGEVVEGQNVVESIESVKKDRRDKPLEDVVIEKLEIKKVQ
jgi:peptidyl-prolyl cis-trans isomerase A (cyclophilin A)